VTNSRALNVTDHSRDAAGLRYVYPVISRRSGGVSVGINLNPNNACNWRCIYCQVPDLHRGAAPAIDLPMLERELREFLHELLHGRFMEERVPAEARRISDIAISGNGEPTSARTFDTIVDLVSAVIKDVGLVGTVKPVLITNGSLVDQPPVKRGLQALAMAGGEVWFKLDRATRSGLRLINGASISPARVAANLESCARSCPTWLQTCVFSIDGQPPNENERKAWYALVGSVLARGVKLRGVLIYSLARPSLQPEAPRLSRVADAWIADFEDGIRSLGLTARRFD
jgi:wyosine [tRNA(Phe)-imidazoG37] synthetase (radical SAM superfamily)